jgi:hypothetical protein
VEGEGKYPINRGVISKKEIKVGIPFLKFV